jgi:predicted nucleic acid binding AN1-type Zn finger protein
MDSMTKINQQVPVNLITETQQPVDKIENNDKKDKKKKKKNRCYFKGCNKKLTISTVTCKCNKRFCPQHRLQAQHNCKIVNTINKELLMEQFGLGGGNFKKLEVI